MQAETGNMAVYKSMGLSTGRLRRSFALRFLYFGIAFHAHTDTASHAVCTLVDPLFLIAAFLAVFLAVIGRMGTWLGPNGEGSAKIRICVKKTIPLSHDQLLL